MGVNENPLCSYFVDRQGNVHTYYRGKELGNANAAGIEEILDRDALLSAEAAREMMLRAWRRATIVAEMGDGYERVQAAGRVASEAFEVLWEEWHGTLDSLEQTCITIAERAEGDPQ